MSASDDSNPYTSPESATPTSGLNQEQQAAAPFRSGSWRAMITMALLNLLLIATVMLLFKTLGVISLLNAISDTGTLRPQDAANLAQQADTLESRMGFWGLTRLGIALVAMIAYLMWIHRAYRNSQSLGSAGLRYSPAWTVGYYFIPILHLFRPLQAMNDIWKASDSDTDASSQETWRTASLSPLLKLWWGMNILASLVGWLTLAFLPAMTQPSRSSIHLLINLRKTTVMGYAIELCTILLTIALINRINRRQALKAAVLGLESARTTTPIRRLAVDLDRRA